MKYTDWSLKLHGTYEGPWGLKISPMLRHQAGQNYGRTFTAVLNYGTIRIPAEPINTRRQDNVNIFDFRAEKVFRRGRDDDRCAVHRSLQRVQRKSRQNITWASGSSFLRPTNIVPPRVARIGAKVNW